MESNQVIKALGALAQDSRLAIVRLLIQAGPLGLSVGKIAEPLAISSATSLPMEKLDKLSLQKKLEEIGKSGNEVSRE
jgi:predicted transcriptional regulator